MGETKHGLTRREMIRHGVATAVATRVGLTGLGAAASMPSTRVVVARRPEILGADGEPRAEALAALLDEAVAALVGVGDPAEAWSRLVSPRDVVGVKTNRWRSLHTPEALEAAIVARVRGAGVGSGDVAVDDQGVLRNPVFGRATALVNARPMRTHYWAGLGTCLKNYIMFAETPSDYHENACASLGSIWTLPHVRGKTRLNVLVMLTPLFHGVGPHSFSRTYTWPYGGLVVSADPVAADSIGAAIITAKRRAYFGEDRPISPPPHHITFADTKYGVGTSRLDQIEIVRLGERVGTFV